MLPIIGCSESDLFSNLAASSCPCLSLMINLFNIFFVSSSPLFLIVREYTVHRIVIVALHYNV